METTLHPSTKTLTHKQRPFSLPIYLLLVFALSWPFQIAYIVWGVTGFASYLLSSISMVMVSVATFIAGRYIFCDGFKNAGWRWGKPVHYLATFGLALFIFAVPAALELLLGLHLPPAGFALVPALVSFLVRLLGTLIPGFGEEFGWRGYMLPHLARRCAPRRALLLHAFIWWAWHLPVVLAIGVEQNIGATPAQSMLLIVAITLLPSMMNAVLFAYVWSATQSLAVASFYHAAYDEVRDGIEQSIGFGPLVSLWEMGVTLLLGAILLWKGSWKSLK